VKRAKLGLGDLLPVGVTLVVVGLALAFGLQVTGEVKDDIGTDSCSERTDGYTTYNETGDHCLNASGSRAAPTSADWNATGDAVEGTGNLSSKLPTIGLIAGVVVVIGLLVRNFAFK